MKTNIYAKLSALALLALAAGPVAAADAATMFENLSEFGPAIAKMLTDGAFVVGVFLIAAGLLALPRVEKGQATLKAVAYRVLVGSALCSVGAALSAMSGTTGIGGGEASILAGKYAELVGGGGNKWCGAMKGVFVFVSLVGLIAFLRGLLLLKAHGEGTQGASIGRAATHLVGGSLAINITATATMLMNSFGVTAIGAVLCIGG